MIYQRSSQLFAEAEKVIPGGVNSPVRAFKGVGGTPIFAKSAKGAYLYDEDDNRLIDYINSWGPMILGHAFQPVVEAIIEKAKKGTSFGMPTELETKIAELAVSMVPNIDKIRFVNSGTEACMSAIRLARGYSNRDKIIKFAGCYHGHSDSFLIQAGSGASTFGTPNSPGVTQGTAKDTLLANYNDIENVKALFEANKNEIAAIIIEPVAGNMGCVPPIPGFLQSLRQLCDENNTLLIFDEVQCGMGRTGRLFAHEWANVTPDIMMVAKGIGGGFPLGAVLATEDAASGMVAGTHGSTYGGNPLACAVGARVTEIISDPAFLAEVNRTAGRLRQGLESLIARHPEVFESIRGQGLMLGLKCKALNTDIVKAGYDAGVLTVAAADNVLRLLPPLNLTEADVAEALTRLEAAAALLETQKAS